MSSAATLLPAVSFETLFKSNDAVRDKFIARLFGIFSERIVRIWAGCDWAPFEDLGRPTLRLADGKQGGTLDFALRSRSDDRVFAAELKCWPEYRGGRYLTLPSAAWLSAHHNKTLRLCLDFARDSSRYRVLVKRREVKTSGAILIWGKVNQIDKRTAKRSLGLYDIFALEDIIDDLLAHDVPEYQELLNKHLNWCTETFGMLAGRGRPLNRVKA